MRGFGSIVTASAIAALLLSGCVKNSPTDKPDAKVSGPITDADSSGFKPTPEPQIAMGDPQKGETVFNANCSTCHGAGGAGGGIGPVLKGEKSRKDYAQAIAWIKNPQAPMPKLYPGTISEADVQNVASYVETL